MYAAISSLTVKANVFSGNSTCGTEITEERNTHT